MSALTRPETSPPRQTAEDDVVGRVQAGDRQAFAVLYADHQRFVYRYLYFRTRNQHLAEDLTQEVFIRALRHIDGFTWQGTAFTAWLLTIARNLHLDEVKTKRSRVETLVPELRDGDVHDRSTEFAALRALDAIETREAVWSALHTLNAHQRQCVEMRFIGELSPEETAQAMGRTVGAVKALTFRAMRKLRTTSERETAA